MAGNFRSTLCLLAAECLSELLRQAMSSGAGADETESGTPNEAAPSSKRARHDEPAAAAASDGGAYDAVASLMSDGFDRGEAAAAAYAVADLAHESSPAAEQAALELARLAEAGQADALANAGAIRALLSASTTHPSSNPILHSLSVVLEKLGEADSLTPDIPWLTEASELLVKALAA